MLFLSSYNTNLIIFIALNAANQVSTLQQQYITFYTEYNSTGDSVTFRTPQNNFFNSEYYIRNAKSMCLIGMWRLFDESNFEPLNWDLFMGLIYGHISLRLEYCSDINQDVMQPQFSIRQIGSNDLDAYALSLYSGVDYSGTHLITEGYLNTLPFKVNSFIITGNSSWTFFSGSNHTGEKSCIVASGNFGRDEIFTTENSDVTSRRTIGSVRKGCD